MNHLKVNRQQSIMVLYQQGWSKRRIARGLKLDRATVRKSLGDSKSPTPQNRLAYCLLLSLIQPLQQFCIGARLHD
jgi:transposase